MAQDNEVRSLSNKPFDWASDSDLVEQYTGLTKGPDDHYYKPREIQSRGTYSTLLSFHDEHCPCTSKS